MSEPAIAPADFVCPLDCVCHQHGVVGFCSRLCCEHQGKSLPSRPRSHLRLVLPDEGTRGRVPTLVPESTPPEYNEPRWREVSPSLAACFASPGDLDEVFGY